MIFQLNHPSSVVREGYTIASAVLTDPEFHDKISNVKKFTYTKHSPLEVAMNFRLVNQVKVSVEQWHYRNPRVIATTFKNKPCRIFVNNNGMQGRKIEDYLSNACHELAHAIGYSHSTNWPPGHWMNRVVGDWEDKSLSVPHTLQRLSVVFAKEKSWI